MGLTACNNEDVPTPAPVDGDSWASITVKFPAGTTLKALPGDYNQKDTYTGRDEIETVDVFLVNVAANTVNYNSFVKSSFESIDTDGILKPNLVLTATAGEEIKVYAVINGEASIISTLKGTTAGNFATAFAGVANKIASGVATYDAVSNKEKIMMTNDGDSYTINVLPAVTEAEAKAGTKNHAQVSVERVVSRAMLTVETSGTGWPVNAVIGGTETKIATVTDVTYAVGQSNNNFYIMKKSNYEVPDPVYTYVPAGADWGTTGTGYFDYSGLASFTTVAQYTYASGTLVADLRTLLNAETTSKFVLPVNHLVDEADLAAARAGYKKGNTTYMEIRAAFTPEQVTKDDDTTVPGTTGTTVYLGANDNKFYETRAKAEAAGQEATEYLNGVMKYVIWLNPNSLVATPALPNPMVSPTVRNQVYHAHINAFTRMGVPNNPLDPTDPDNPDNPKNPIDPNDPLKTDVTYLSVSVKVLPWTMHSYGITLGGDIY